MQTLTTDGPVPLTVLTEQERLFQDAVREFATTELAPKVGEMDRTQTMDTGIVRRLFELGLMGIEIPENVGGTGADFFTPRLRQATRA